METTYAHLKDSDHIREAREAFDLETEPAESELTPEICPRCGENPPANARLCHWCGLAFTPDAKEFVEQVEGDVRETYRSVDATAGEAGNTLALVQQFDELLSDPDRRAALLDLLGETPPDTTADSEKAG